MKYTQVATIPMTAKRCAAEGIGITEWQLRSLCKDGSLVCSKIGRKSLIYWPNLIKLLEEGTCAESNKDYGTIRKIEE